MQKKYNIPKVFRPGGRNASVRYKSTKRFDEANNQAQQKVVCIDKIVQFVNEYLDSLDMKTIECNKLETSVNKFDNAWYKSYQEKYSLQDQRDIVWMKFTTDGYLGVVATSDDINFVIPSNKSEYRAKVKSRWQFNTSGIIIHNLGKEWNTSFVLVFPLINIPENLKRGDIESGIGNYLIEKEVPILDFYSHRY